MEIIVAGLPCKKTDRAFANVNAAVRYLNLDIPIRLVTTIQGMKSISVKHTPTVIIRQKQKVEGRIPSIFEVQTWIEEELMENAEFYNVGETA
jgi:protein-disulfide isomerase